MVALERVEICTFKLVAGSLEKSSVLKKKKKQVRQKQEIEHIKSTK